MSIFPTQHEIAEDIISSLEKIVPSVATFAEKDHSTIGMTYRILI